MDTSFLSKVASKSRRGYNEVAPFIKSQYSNIQKDLVYRGLTEDERAVLQVILEGGVTDYKQIATYTGMNIQNTLRVIKDLVSMGKLKVTESPKKAAPEAPLVGKSSI